MIRKTKYKSRLIPRRLCLLALTYEKVLATVLGVERLQIDQVIVK